MKGIVFTEFMEMVESAHSSDMVDDIIEDACLPSGGAYTSVGTYDHAEMVSLVSALSRRTGMAVPELLKAFGEYLFGRFHTLYPAFFAGINDAFQFLEGIESIIHAEVRKLYPEAELPSFVIELSTSEKLILVYESRRHLEDLAEGLILGCLRHFGGGVVRREHIETGTVSRERFIIERS